LLQKSQLESANLAANLHRSDNLVEVLNAESAATTELLDRITAHFLKCTLKVMELMETRERNQP
jgi:hypothetical protein